MAILKYITRPTFVLMNRPQIKGELYEHSAYYRDFLIDTVPIEHLARTFKKAVELNTNSFAPNYFDVKNAWQNLKAQDLAAENAAAYKTRNAIADCRYAKELHINGGTDHDVGEVEDLVQFTGAAEKLVSPCPYCRQSDFEDWKKTNIALYGEIKRADIQFHGEKYRGAIAALKFETIEPDKAALLVEEYTELIDKYTDDETAKNHLTIVFDGTVFKHPDRADITYEPRAMRRKIEDLKRILGAKSETPGC